VRSPPVYGRERIGTPREARQLLAGSGRRATLGWTRRIQQWWMCSLAYRSGVEPPLPRLYTAGPVRSSCFWVASRCSFRRPSHWHPGAVRAADGLAEVVRLSSPSSCAAATCSASLTRAHPSIHGQQRPFGLAWDQDSVGITERFTGLTAMCLLQFTVSRRSLRASRTTTTPQLHCGSHHDPVLQSKAQLGRSTTRWGV
jgi:hypothetical protein